MATDDVTEHSVTCPCGKSTVTFITSSPDHPWVRASQTRYSATMDCKECREKYAVHQESHNDQPVIVHRDEVDAKKAAQEKYRAADEAIKQSEEAEHLRPKIIAAIDNETSMAARHRKLSEFRLSYESYGTYRKRPYGGAEAIRQARGADLARIDNTAALGAKDQQYFVAAVAELEKLANAERSIRPKPVKLGSKSD